MTVVRLTGEVFGQPGAAVHELHDPVEQLRVPHRHPTMRLGLQERRVVDLAAQSRGPERKVRVHCRPANASLNG